MKNKFFCMLVVMTAFSFTLSAQNKYGVGAGLGFSRLTGELGKKGGFGFSYNIEAKYYLTEKIAAGLLYGSNALVYKEDSNLLGLGTYGNRQIFALGEYYFTTGNVRPYAGLALGYSGISTPEITITSGGQTSTIPSEKKANFGVAPHFGLMIKNFGMEFRYNLSGKTPKSEYQNVDTANKPFNFYTVRLKYVYEF